MPRQSLRRSLISLCAVLCLAALAALTVPAYPFPAAGAAGGPARPGPDALTALAGQVRDGRPLQRGPARHIAVPSGLPVVRDAVVTLPGLHRRTTTSADGYFAFRNLRIPASSAYTLIVQKKGFGRWQESGIRLVPGMPAQVYVELHSAALALQVPRPVPQPDNGPAGHAGQAVAPDSCPGNSSGWTSQTEEPPTIRVYMTGQHGSTDAGDVISYDFSFYEQHVLPDEWEAGWDEPALEAGAVAVRDYAWHFVVNGSKGTIYTSAGDPNPCSFDVDDYIDYQDFDPFAPSYNSTSTAVNRTADYLYTQHSAIPETGYDSGSQKDSCGQDYGTRETGTMSQWGTQACAQGGEGWRKILATYYGYKLTPFGSRGPAVAVDKSGNVFAFWQNSGGGLEEALYSAATRTWSGPSAVTAGGKGMGPLGSPPTVALGPQDSGGYADQYVFWKGTAPASGLWEAYWNGSWHGPLDLGDGPLGSAPAAGADRAGDVDIFWENTGQGLEETSWNGSAWTAPSAISVNGSRLGPLGSSPSVAVAPDGDQYVFWRAAGAGAGLQEAYWTGSWHGPAALGDGPLASPPAAADSSGKVYVFWENASGDLEQAAGSGSSWDAASAVRVNGSVIGPLGSAPAAAAGPATGYRYLLWRGPGSSASLWDAFWDGSWHGPADLGLGPVG
ncbi:MAG: carboxypeptidase regulatory-like domain-containing protein [Streptosporangiaceae bacterium]